VLDSFSRTFLRGNLFHTQDAECAPHAKFAFSTALQGPLSHGDNAGQQSAIFHTLVARIFPHLERRGRSCSYAWRFASPTRNRVIASPVTKLRLGRQGGNGEPGRERSYWPPASGTRPSRSGPQRSRFSCSSTSIRAGSGQPARSLRPATTSHVLERCSDSQRGSAHLPAPLVHRRSFALG